MIKLENNLQDDNTDLEIADSFKKKKHKKNKFYKFFKSFILIFILTLLILFTIVIKTNISTFLRLSKEMLKNEPSIVISSDGTTIAQIRW